MLKEQTIQPIPKQTPDDMSSKTEPVGDASVASKHENIQSVFELGGDIEKYGGVQKFVLLNIGGRYLIGSFAGLSHHEILSRMGLNKNTPTLGGGMLSYSDGTITIDTSFKTSKLGPIAIPYSELKGIMQEVVGDKYRVEISE